MHFNYVVYKTSPSNFLMQTSLNRHPAEGLKYSDKSENCNRSVNFVFMEMFNQNYLLTSGKSTTENYM